MEERDRLELQNQEYRKALEEIANAFGGDPEHGTVFQRVAKKALAEKPVGQKEMVVTAAEETVLSWANAHGTHRELEEYVRIQISRRSSNA
jgi:hypothetical protein